ncbi:MAG TPA: amidohydrolase family protein [Phnomibacter sp.]|nr:amidohydrolase family protein [Phnomibacter sp.]
MKLTVLLLSLCMVLAAPSKTTTAQTVLFEKVNVFDGKTNAIKPNQYVLIEGNSISKVSATPIAAPAGAKTINGQGKTLMPGMIDVHVHLMYCGISMQELNNPEVTLETVGAKAAEQAQNMLMRGFTAVRDVGGPVFPLKAAIDKGQVKGPRIWPSGATVSQTAGHGDMRLPHEQSRRFHGQVSRAEKLEATYIADGRDEVLTAVRENLRKGASQIKVMAGGGTSSAYDPVDVTQYTLDEIKAAVEAAEDWGTYITVHAYTPRAVRRCIEAGVKCIEHGQLLDEATLKLMKAKGTWLSCQYLVESTPDMDPLRKLKRQPVIEGQKKIWGMAKRLGVNTAWGTDFLFEPELNALQTEYLLKLKTWLTNYDILKMVTYDNARLLALSGLRSPYQGKLGMVAPGYLADLILVNGNPLKDIELLGKPNDNFAIIMKDGQIVKEQLH